MGAIFYFISFFNPKTQNPIPNNLITRFTITIDELRFSRFPSSILAIPFSDFPFSNFNFPIHQSPITDLLITNHRSTITIYEIFNFQFSDFHFPIHQSPNQRRHLELSDQRKESVKVSLSLERMILVD